MSPTARATGMGAALLWLSAIGAGATAQESSAFTVTLGTDTITVERFNRAGASISGELLTRYYVPATVHIRYRGMLDNAGNLRQLSMSARPARPVDSTEVLWRVDVTFNDTSVIVRRRGNSTDTLRVPAARDALPFLIGSFGLMELATRRVRTRGGQSDTVVYVQLPGGAVLRRRVVLNGTDSATIGFILGQASAQVDADGRILRLDGGGSSYKVKVERLPSIDFASLLQGFVAQDSSGRALGSLSPRDSVLGMVGTVSVRMHYGSPKRRGRLIMGGVVPWNTEWRTGANEPTMLEISAPLRIGGVLAAAGSYDVTTLPTLSGVTLVLRRSGADEEKEAIRVPMRVDALTTLVEDFTIGVVADDGAPRIEMSWERTRWVVTLDDPQRSRRR